MSYYISNDPSARNIYNLIESVDRKLSQRSKTNSYYYPKMQNDMDNYPNKNLGNYRTNSIPLSAKLNQNDLPNNTHLSNYELRKIIKEELESLIKPFEQEVFKNFSEIESDIANLKKNNNYNNLLNSKNDLYNSQNLKESMKKNLYDYVPFKDFEKKMKDLEEKIEKKDKNEKMAIYTIDNDIKNVKEEIQEIKNKCKEIEESNKLELKKKDDANERNKNEEKLKEIKLKDSQDKIAFLEKNFESLRQNVYDIKNNANIRKLEDNNSLNELRSKYDSLNNFDIKYNKVNSDITKLKDNIQKLNTIIGDLNDRNSNYENNFDNRMNLNNNYESKVQDALKKLDLEKEKFTVVSQNYEKLLKYYIKLSKIVEYQNNLLNDLNLKFKSKENNENGKYDSLDRQIQYMQNQLERISIDIMNKNKDDDDNKFKKERILLLQKDIDYIKKDIGEINRLIENDQTKKDEENERIKKIVSELKEENKKKIEEITNKIEEEIGKMKEEKGSSTNNIDYESMLKTIEKEIKRIDEDFKKFEEEKKKKIEEEKIKRIEDENRLKINEEKIKKLEEDNISKEKENANGIYDERLTKLEEKLRKIEEEKNIEIKSNGSKGIIDNPEKPPISVPLEQEDKSDSHEEYSIDEN